MEWLACRKNEEKMVGEGSRTRGTTILRKAATEKRKNENGKRKRRVEQL